MIRIRKATNADAPHIERIIRESFLSSYKRFLPGSRMEEVIDFSQVGTPMCTLSAGFKLALIDSEPAGVILLDGDYIDHLWVLPEHQRQNVGSALLQHAEEEARAHGHTRLTLNVYEANDNARRFYRKHGFVSNRRFKSTQFTDPQQYVIFKVKDLG